MSKPVLDQTSGDVVDVARQGTPALGFWIYLMTDCLLFGSLFATYAVLRNATYGGASGKDLFNMPFVLTETLILLTSSFVCGLTILAARNNRKRLVITGLVITGILGAAFLTLELSEFTHLAQTGHSWQASAFLSAFFTLVGTHGLHITVGILWIGVMVWQIVVKGLTHNVIRRLTLFSLFWHFLDVIWIFIFTFVYLMGVI
jgi:cytochrome o ubiquinol oxidase subunit 3